MESKWGAGRRSCGQSRQLSPQIPLAFARAAIVLRFVLLICAPRPQTLPFVLHLGPGTVITFSADTGASTVPHTVNLTALT